ncbi:hypothetical protein Syun_023553 [Stephania yunnanensis]|uniref:Uncharacterized protein n=1 Tax=Stephania yunnanensis TaxID=152371 RepID=A0AAP0FCJ1_9MAGN
MDVGKSEDKCCVPLVVIAQVKSLHGTAKTIFTGNMDLDHGFVQLHECRDDVYFMWC